MLRYRLGDVDFCLTEPEISFEKDKYIAEFKVEEKYISKKAIVLKNNMLSLERYKESPLIIGNETYELYNTQKGKLIVYHWAHCRFGFGYWLEDLEKGNTITYHFHPEMIKQIPMSVTRFLSCAGIHSKLLQRGAMVLHGSYIEWNGKAILFIAPSGTGKSTQAELWRQYARAEIINGDRALVKKKDGVWHSFGYPCCGSSNICINRTLPLEAIVVLEQGAENRIEKISYAKKVRALVTGTEVFKWNQDEIEKAFKLAEELVEEIPIIKLVCLPDKDAVKTLREYLEER